LSNYVWRTHLGTLMPSCANVIGVLLRKT
jgi:hypothetical protein